MLKHLMYKLFPVVFFPKAIKSSPLLMSSSWGSGDGLSFDGDGDVLTPAPGLVGALN